MRASFSRSTCGRCWTGRLPASRMLPMKSTDLPCWPPSCPFGMGRRSRGSSSSSATLRTYAPRLWSATQPLPRRSGNTGSPPSAACRRKKALCRPTAAPPPCAPSGGGPISSVRWIVIFSSSARRAQGGRSWPRAFSKCSPGAVLFFKRIALPWRRVCWRSSCSAEKAAYPVPSWRPTAVRCCWTKWAACL